MLYAATINLIHNLGGDARRYASLGGAFGHRGFWVGANYRLGVWLRELPEPLRALLRVPQKVLDALFKTAFNVHIHPHAQIGAGLCLIHPWNVLIGACVIGENCLIFHEVTLGTNANGDGLFPTIGNNVDIYVGARILGSLTIGDDAQIGANCVVFRSVPRGSTVAAPAPSIISAAAQAAFGTRSKAEAE